LVRSSGVGGIWLSRAAQLYVAATVAGTAVAIALSAKALPGPVDVPLVCACLALAVLSEAGGVSVSDNVYVSGTALVGALSVLWLAPPVAALIMLAGVFTGQRLMRRPWSRAIFNASLFALCTWTAAAVFRLLAGQADMAVTTQILVPYLLMLAAWNVTNVLVLSGLLGLLNRCSPVRFWVSIERAGFYNQVVFAVLGLFMEAIFVQMGLLGILFIFLLLLAVRVTFQLYANNRNFYREITGVLERALTFKDPDTGSHSERVALLATELGKELGIVDTDLDLLRHAALLHDVGKVAVPDAILGKPGPLDPRERTAMDQHVAAADNILETSRYLGPLAEMVRGHHERLDGKGYPDRIEGGGIPLASRIIAVADAYDAMTQDRPYRAALPEHEVVLRLLAGSGTQFDPAVVRALFRIKGYSEALPATATPVQDPAPQPPLVQAAGSESPPPPLRIVKRRRRADGV
jgi:putative nucleotidyltransferase with HDIG domain